MPITYAAARQGEVVVTLLHTNDVHGVARGADAPFTLGLRPAQGLLRIATLINDIRRINPNTLALDAGDAFHGTPMVYAFRGEPMTALMNAAGYDAFTLGNHEFEWGLDALAEHVRRARFDVLSANVRFPPGGDFRGVKPYIIREFKGVRIAVVGVTTQETMNYLWPRYVTGLEIDPPVETLAALMPELKEKSDFIVVLSHLGMKGDVELATAVPGIDMILGGHTHTAVYPPVESAGAPIFNTGSHGAALGRIDIMFETGADGRARAIKSRNTLIAVDGTTREHPALTAIYEKYRDVFERAAGRKLAESWVTLDASDMRKRENRLGGHLADLLRKSTGAEIAVIDTTLIEAGLKEGDVLVRDMYTVLTAYTRQNVVVGRLTGARIRDALEHAVSGYRAPMLLQVSGISCKIDPTAPPGGRVGRIDVADAPLDENRLYSVASSSHLFMGGTGFFSFTDAALVSDTGVSLRDMIMRRMRLEHFIWPEFPDRFRIVEGLSDAH